MPSSSWFGGGDELSQTTWVRVTPQRWWDQSLGPLHCKTPTSLEGFVEQSCSTWERNAGLSWSHSSSSSFFSVTCNWPFFFFITWSFSTSTTVCPRIGYCELRYRPASPSVVRLCSGLPEPRGHSLLAMIGLIFFFFLSSHILQLLLFSSNSKHIYRV